jgi:L-alanine-DL-glutamate epimerase-like enolase superfamily enzyme
MRVEHVEVEVQDSPESTTTKQDALQTLPGCGSVQVHVETDVGISGRGEVGFGRIEGGPDTVAALIENELVPIVLDTKPSMVRKTHQEMLRETEYHGSFGLSMFGISALDTALWDCVGRELEAPCWKIWGAAQERIPAYAMVGWLNQDMDEFQEQCQAAIDQGFKSVKIKVGSDSLERDKRLVETAREVVGDGGRVMVDANQSLTVSEAVRRGRAFEDLDCHWFEEPIPAHDLDGYMTLSEKLDIQIATGENLYLQTQFGQFLRRDAVDIIQPDLRRAGGPSALLAIGQTANSLNTLYASHGSPQSGGPVHLHVMASLPNVHYLESGLIPEDSPMELVDGAIELPDGPGFAW